MYVAVGMLCSGSAQELVHHNGWTAQRLNQKEIGCGRGRLMRHCIKRTAASVHKSTGTQRYRSGAETAPASSQASGRMTRLDRVTLPCAYCRIPCTKRSSWGCDINTHTEVRTPDAHMDHEHDTPRSTTLWPRRLRRMRGRRTAAVTAVTRVSAACRPLLRLLRPCLLACVCFERSCRQRSYEHGPRVTLASAAVP